MSDEQKPPTHPVVLIPAILGCGSCGSLLINPNPAEPLSHTTAAIDLFCPKCDVLVHVTVPRLQFPVVGQAPRIQGAGFPGLPRR
jgi:hypothetical protein